MNKTFTEIQSQTDLSALFLDFELQVILTEVFYLPRFLWDRQINSPEDICHHVSMPKEKVLERLRQIYSRRPLFLGVQSPETLLSDDQARYIAAAELIEPGPRRDHLVQDLLMCKVPLIIFGENPSQVFSSAMYLAEEGAAVSSYFITGQNIK